MRKIEKLMLNACQNNKAFSLDTTKVSPIDAINCAVYLYGHHIADYNSETDFVMVNMNTLKKYPTNATRSRLRALGVNVYTKKGKTFIDEKSIYS